jgi:hypothetical protein
MTEAGTIGAKIDITTKGEDVAVDMANEAEEVDEAGVEDMEENPPDSIPSTTTITKTTGAVRPGEMTEVLTEDLMDKTPRRLESILPRKQ